MNRTKKIYGKLKEYKVYYSLALLLLCCDGIVTYYYPGILSKIIDVCLPAKDWNRALVQMCLLAGCQLVSITVSFLLSVLFCKLTNKFIFYMKHIMIQAVFRAKGEELSSKSEKFLTCMGMDINNIQILTSRMMADFILEIATMLITIVILCKINYVILIAVIILYPILIVIQNLFNKMIQQQSRQVMTYMDCENTYTKELSRFMEEYILMNLSGYYLNRFHKNQRKLLGESLKLNIDLELNRVIPQVISILAYCVILGISGYMVISGRIMLGEFTVVLLYTQRVFAPLSTIMIVIGQLQKSKVSVDRIADIL